METQPTVHPGTVASIQTIFQRSRLNHRAWQPRRREGRIDGRQVWRNDALRHVDIFKERNNPSVTKLNVHLLVDSSGSMVGQRTQAAQDCVATLVEAFKRQPTVRLHVWQHHATLGRCQVARVYTPGRGTKGIRRMHEFVAGGNADGFALEYVGKRALKMAYGDEITVVVMISDGAPSAHGKDATNYDLTLFSRQVSTELRLGGAHVLSVAIAGDRGLNADMYGSENVMNFDAHSPTAWADFGRDLARVFGALLR